MCIVTGPRIDLAITLIDRMKRLFMDNSLVTFESKETVIELNGVHIEAYPSHHLDAMRGLSDVSVILLDEADFFPPGQQQDARDVSERYIAKSHVCNNFSPLFRPRVIPYPSFLSRARPRSSIFNGILVPSEEYV